MELSDQIISVKGIGEKSAALFYKAGIYTVRDLLDYFPGSYSKLSPIKKINDINKDGRVTVNVRVQTKPALFRVGGKNILKFRVSDDSGSLNVSIFNMPYLKNSIMPGRNAVLNGMYTFKKNGWQLSQPRFMTEEEYRAEAGIMKAVYPQHGALTSAKISKAVNEVMPVISDIEEYLPESVLSSENLIERKEAVKLIHSPVEQADIDAARKRLAFDEVFMFLLRIQLLKEKEEKESTEVVISEDKRARKLTESLPYELTGAQKKAIEDIDRDMKSGYCMNRLLQGDVGCGKTAVAFISAMKVIDAGYQAAIMAPTEVLAAQHYKDICDMNAAYGLNLKPVLITGALKAAEKREALKQTASGSADIIIGTHALIQEKVEYAKLGLVVTDEQHRFGVRQRLVFGEKGLHPHVLVMSATPIPRTLGLILYGDLDVSIIDELPAKRLPIKNTVLDISWRPKLYSFILKRISEGRQAYIICPMVEENEELDGVSDVESYSEKLRELMPPEIRIDMLHGRMKDEEKKSVMETFSKGETDILVSTTVVEVGVNVPNATVMMIENAERFGLSQLHQLRGRVGRGSEQSYCIFVAGGEGEQSKKALERLDILSKTNDGFKIAEEDLKQRGPGDLFGLRQSGMPLFRMADIYEDSEMIKRCSSLIGRLLSTDYTFREKTEMLLSKKEEGKVII